jgi:signal transduction histidine kinase/ligand-binding sensor domain-containing protein
MNKACSARPLAVRLALSLIIVSSLHVVYALDPARSLSQYVRDRWGAESGIPPGSIYAIAQTNEGYLWIGTDQGLVRFDGQRFSLIRNTDSHRPLRPVLALTADNDGALWVRLRQPFLLRYQRLTFEDAMPLLGWPYSMVSATARAHDGSLLAWLEEGGGRLLVQQGERFQTAAPTRLVPGALVLSMAQMPNGNIWLGTRDAGLFRLTEGQAISVSQGLPDSKINCLAVRGDNLWIGTDNGAVRWNGSSLTQSGVPPILRHSRILAMTTDRDSNLWVSADPQGLVRLDKYGAASAEEAADEARQAVTALFEDREGDLWVGRASGMERIRSAPFVTYAQPQGVAPVGPIYADAGGRVWIAPLTGGLCWLANQHYSCLAAFNHKITYSIDGGKDGLWIGGQHDGLTHIRFNRKAPVAANYRTAQGLAQDNVGSVHESRDGAVWAGTLSGGVSKFYRGKFTTYTTASGLPSNTVSAIDESADGTIWLGTLNGLTALSENRLRTYTIRDGLPSDSVNCLLVDPGNVLWIGTAKGLAFLNSATGADARHETMEKLASSSRGVLDAATVLRGFVKPDRIEAARAAPLRESILGIAEDKQGWLWISTANRVLRVNQRKLLRNALTETDWREYGIADGLEGLEGVRRCRSVIRDSSGRIWFSLNGGVSEVDPAHLPNQTAPTTSVIQTLEADGNLIRLQGPVRVQPLPQRIKLGYAGLSLSLPERVRFRYMLEGFDRTWNNPVSTREAVYTNLGPGSYRFRVVASSPDGIWNGPEASFRFQVEPAFWQTWWFRLCGVLLLAAATLAIYRLHLRQFANQLNLRFEERLSERTRIAQELHDTLLQGFVSVSMQLHVAATKLPRESLERSQVTRALNGMRRVLEDGRNAIRGLRSTRTASLDLEEALSLVQNEFDGQGIDFRVISEGGPRSLHPIVRDEIYRIGREALVNAFRHSGATRIETEVRYASGQLRLVIRDNGFGMDPKASCSDQSDHRGLRDMRQRSDKIGAQFHLWSGTSSGTEVELRVPGRIAFSSAHSPRTWFARLQQRKP